MNIIKNGTKKNKEKILLNKKEYYDAHVEEILIKNKEKYKRYKENGKIKEWTKKYYDKNKNNLIFMLKRWCRGQVWRCLNFISTNKTKDQHTFDILNYTPEQLKQRLEMQFKDGMSWKNYGTVWEIDHHKELYKFNFIDEDGNIDYHQVFLANCLANLRPLDIEENRGRSGKRL